MQEKPLAWEPLLSGELALHAGDAIEAIARTLRNGCPVGQERDALTLSDAFSLADGAAGISIFFAQLARHTGRASDREASLSALSRAVTELERAPAGIGLFQGATGVAWAVAHHRRLFPTEHNDDPCGEFDDALLDALAMLAPAGQFDFDLISGLAGIGMYCAMRREQSTMSEAAARIVGFLGQAARQNTGHTWWWTSAVSVPPVRQTKFPDGYADLGVAHGQAGIIGFLGCALANGIAQAQCRRLLARAIPWLLAQEADTGGVTRFPAFIAGTVSEPSRVAWCYGDLGIALVLARTARVMDRVDWWQHAYRIALRLARLDPSPDVVDDATLCHGASGVAHLFARWYFESGDVQFARAAVDWLRYTIDLREEGAGVAGYRGLRWRLNGETHWKKPHGLLYGAAGVGLVLLSAAHPVAPDWDRLVTLS